MHSQRRCRVWLLWARGPDYGDPFLSFGGQNCCSRDALVEGQIFLCDFVGGHWRGCADWGSGVLVFFSRDAVESSSEHYGGGPFGANVYAADDGAAEGSGRD